jgi:histidinol-phosphate/aromatic aminotransferase/cobyric acid decarboxylase-like protein
MALLRAAPKANRVLQPDGRFINVPRHRGQFFVCATGCCCGRVERGFAPGRDGTSFGHPDLIRMATRHPEENEQLAAAWQAVYD